MKFRMAFLAVYYLLLIVFLIPFLLFCMLTGLREPLIAVGKWAVRVGQRLLGVKVEVVGLDKLEPGTAYVFMPNHLSFLDGPLVLTIIPGAARAILKKSVLRIPILGRAMRFVGFVPVDRRGAEGGKKSIARAAALMQERGYSYLIFPEGTRSRDGRLGVFRRGGFFLALESQAPIVPITIRGSFELMPKGQWFARKGKVRFAFHDPVPVRGHSQETMSDLMERVRRAISGSGVPAVAGETGPGVSYPES